MKWLIFRSQRSSRRTYDLSLFFFLDKINYLTAKNVSPTEQVRMEPHIYKGFGHFRTTIAHNLRKYVVTHELKLSLLIKSYYKDLNTNKRHIRKSFAIDDSQSVFIKGITDNIIAAQELIFSLQKCKLHV